MPIGGRPVARREPRLSLCRGARRAHHARDVWRPDARPEHDGFYAALAFAVGERTREIAVRLALGASRADVGGLVFRRGMAIVLLGIAAGVAACIIAGPFLAHLLYGVNPRYSRTRAAGPALMIVVAALAIWLPARRAMQQNPIIALRAE